MRSALRRQQTNLPSCGSNNCVEVVRLNTAASRRPFNGGQQLPLSAFVIFSERTAPCFRLPQWIERF